MTVFVLLLFPQNFGNDGLIRSGSFVVAPLNFVVNFLAMNGDIGRRFDPDFHYVALDANHLHADSPIYHDCLTWFSGKNKHGLVLLVDGGQWMLNGIIGSVSEDDLFAGKRKAIDDDRTFEIHSGTTTAAQSDDIQQQRIVGRFQF